MTAGLRVELLRLRSRRAVLLLVLLGLLGCVLLIGFAVTDAVPPSAAELASAKAQVDQQLADPEFQQMLTECRTAVTAGGNSQFPADLDCDQMLPKAEYFVDWRAPDFVEQFRVLLLGITGILTLVFALAGVTFAGADWSSGSIGTQLLFESRRGRVFGSKLGAITLVALVIGAVGVLLAWGASYWMASKWGTTALIGNDPVTGAQVPLSRTDLVGRALRALALIGGGGAGGFALAMMFRSSLVAVGLVAGYGLVGEAVLRSVSSGVEPYLLSSRVAAFLDGQYLIYRYPNVCGTSGCEAEIIRISALQGGAYIGVLIVVVTVASLLLFRRRDVA